MQQDAIVTIMSAKTFFISKFHELELIGKHYKDLDAICTANKHLQVAITVIKSIIQYPSKKSLPIKRKVSPNENCKQQQNFFELRKKEQQLY